MIGIILESSTNQDEITFRQPSAVFFYNNNQIRIPLRYVYYKGNLVDFKSGFEGCIDIIPYVSRDSNGNAKIDYLGAGIYLSPKVFESLFAQTYLLNNPLGRYNDLKLEHVEQDYLVGVLKAQGGLEGNDMAYYEGFRGPIKIWSVSYDSDIKVHEEFLRTSSGQYGEFDNLAY
jgi:hypothetical protein